MASNNNEKLRLLLHPAFPQINTGILLFKQTNKVNTLSNNALFFAIPLSKFKLSANSFSNLRGYSRKSNFIISSNNLVNSFLFWGFIILK